jgi:6-phosphogluconate dehydrogenase
MTTPFRDLALVGLGTMGANLARNFADHGTTLALYDPAPGVAAKLAEELRASAAADLADLVAALARPRVVMLMVPAGEAVDASIAALLPLLDADDIVIDGGNSHYEETERRVATCAQHGVRFLGFGLSGGAEGARHGPAIMAGGETAAVALVDARFRAIAATAEGEECFAPIGRGGAGHFVKMVHNGIEYALMQLIGEAYQLLSGLLGLSVPELRPIFARWAEGELGAFLMECAARVLATSDPESGRPMIDLIADSAGQKGTGRWAANAALEFGAAAPTIAEAVHARCLSGLKPERVDAAAALGAPLHKFAGDGWALIDDIGAALLAANVAVHAQGFALMQAADREKRWGLDLAAIARVWRGGCIIRSRLLTPIARAAATCPPNLLRDPALWELVAARDAAWRRAVGAAVAHGVPVPAFGSALAYVDAYRTDRLWANMIEAQRDLFGAHGFGRLDKPGRFHAQWAPTWTQR